MKFLTDQQQKALCALVLLLLLGWAVKAWRQAHPQLQKPPPGANYSP
jgi:hypothetical protein